jgi:uncharacterized protein (TIGR03067 family)
VNRLLTVFVLALLPTGATTAPVPVQKDDAKKDLALLTGTWEVTSYMQDGEEQIGERRKLVITFKADGSYEFDNGVKGKIVSIDPAKKPKEVDYVQFDSDGDPIPDKDGKPQLERAIYKLEGDTFTDCFNVAGEKRPTEFKSTKENGSTLITYKRVKKVD